MSTTGRLKGETWDLHAMAEKRELQQRLARGEAPRDVYAAWLGQLYLLHRSLEDAIREAAGRHPAVGLVFRDHHRREPQLRDDLAFLGVDVETLEPLPATATLVGAVERAAVEHPVALLGMLYVLEGSTNGAKFIAASLARAYGLTPGAAGLSYMDPHGDLQKQRWTGFKQDMDAAPFDRAEVDLLVEAACTVFQGVADMSDELADGTLIGGGGGGGSGRGRAAGWHRGPG